MSLLPNALSRISSTMLNSSGRSWCPFLISDIVGILFSLSLLSIIFVMDFKSFAFIMLN